MRPGEILIARAQPHQQVVIAALGVTQILAWGSTYYLLSVLAKPIAADTGWPLQWIVGALSAGLLVAGAVSPVVGRTIGRLGGRPVLACSSVLLAIGLALAGAAPSAPLFLTAWLVIGAGMGAGLYDAAFATLGRLYAQAARPAISTLTLWAGFASTICWPLSALLVDQLGWRGTCFVYAAIQLVVSLPMLLVVVPPAPALPPEEERGPDAAAPLGSGERRLMLLLGIVVTLSGLTTSIVSIHLLTLLQARGLALATAVSLGALIGPSQVGARLVEMAGRGRHHPLWTLTAAITLSALGLALLTASVSIGAVALVFYGAGAGVFSIARGTLPLALFGVRRYAVVMGRLALPSLTAQALAPSLGAPVIARLGADATLAILASLGGLNVLVVAALWLVSRGQGRS